MSPIASASAVLDREQLAVIEQAIVLLRRTPTDTILRRILIRQLEALIGRDARDAAG